MTTAAEKTRETRLRRMAERQGFKLVKSRSRDPRAIDYGGFMVIDPHTDSVVAGELRSARAMSIDDVEAWLTDDER